MAWRIPLFNTSFGSEEEAAVLRPVRSAWLTMGEEVLQLEQELRQCTGAKHAVAVCNCTAALQLVAAALELGPGDEVLCPSLSFVASANAPRTTGATIRFCDVVEPGDLTIDPKALEAAITPRTRAIVAVHYAGFACDMDQIGALARRHNLFVIEDCAHALFTTWRGKTLGRYGAAGCFSFYSNKNITCGEGGAITTDDDALAEKIRLMRSHGMTAPTLDRHKGHAFTYDVSVAGFNFRLDEIRAALLRAQLLKLDGYLARRRELFRQYAAKFKNTEIAMPFTQGRFAEEVAQTAVHILPVLLPQGVERASVMQALKDDGIQSSIHYPLIHKFRAYRETVSELPRTEALGERELTLPLYPAMSEGDVSTVVDCLLKACRRK